MKTELVGTLAEFSNHIEMFSLISEPYIFRGQAVKRNLLPSIARKDNSTNSATVEKKMIEQLKLMGASFFPDPALSDLDILVLAQHHGLKTRLLDWTSNPLAALWFACNDTLSGDVYVYALDAHKLIIKDVYRQNPFSQAKTRVFQPRMNDERIIAQHGWFTLHRYSKKMNRYVSIEKNIDLKNRITEFKILEKNREELLESLDRHGIGCRTLFPDLQGLCNHINWKFKLS